ncbi:PREDICTED: uncharacterized protein LOC105854458 isoform X3 [Condylura cristata]|uniref:uncharacterized protein LOC105854458 isoform X3 n=1 Tax=Condylura cristata TaxID=143302 RepID=UPI000642D443|nr:PREDICTED: uncharacterized protein LOC105854458 isoform X3 [Condylura cristata]
MALLVPTALVALTILRAPAWACLLCFTTSNQRYDVCRALVFWPWDRGKCQKSLENAFQHLQHLDIRYEDRPELQKEFLDTLDDLKKWPRRSKLKLSPYQHPFDGAAQAMQEIMKLKPGLQEQIRYYSCQECTPLTCNLPLDCPVQDVTVIRGRQARFSCTVNFTLPHKDVTYIWKFAEGVRTQQQMYFRDLEHSGGSVARIRPALPSHRGTFSCSIFDDELLLARVYFYLNVTGPGSRDQTDLQITFREVLNWSSQPDRELPEPWNPSLLELLTRPDALTPDNWWLLVAIAALQSASLTLLGWVVWEWYISGT